MRRKRVFLLGILLGAIFLVNMGIVSLQDSSKPGIIHYDLTENIPVLLLGSFRGIAVDFLWARAIARHEEKKYYELLTINNLISKLQPNFPAVWIFQAWNMAYNIAHEWDAPQNKWKWIHAGLDFAKRGAVKNPKSGDLFFELGYMYLHLFDQRFFTYAAYYREQLKKEDGEDNYESSLYWLRRSLLNTPKLYNILAIERTICHALGYASACAEKEGNFDKALQYTESAIREWNTYRINHPEDALTYVDDFINTLEMKRVFLQTLLK
ncbi:MAG: hypothetical protein DWB56_00565 [Candidatus Jettenia sp.]|uniref:Uncharacterized protein n=1 Tax=Candidatus Jettenia caeni TaxID=247490 RepID=I3IJ15_9BACT|nr:hypothetical protein [Candidatus Jettenia sp. AMX1]MBC6927445.1 hypothetical protein [Candidatus Jettenia sp.]NUN23324.1 hypothetical protein [Candidatus Jettenia caeni]KAA0249733.1 MAG: hypothetical protein EDM77_07430 [Candidatus Jettenia sp. AMX1]MCE7879128.1 hypothetical protein [Candidatus Jettenia sp. AMX1]MCQ3925753.1 hypothetical protein [Candidatus Jettenia sp.]